ncbi:uncharacterized protein [Primulina huaijiensis]|uniref:uncharacterized protein isoform X11 n=1 Tax=Primulina huaijiensis TaxID=1492673 RepID=UPI003CC77327
MAFGKGNLREEEKSRNAAATAASSSVVFTDAVLYATMCIVGMPVDVHARDGSVNSGIFYTACVDRDFATELKNARMIKKGNQEANVVSGSLIDTLTVPSENFALVVAKDIRLPANAVTGSGGGKGLEEANVGYIEYPEREAKVIMPNESGGDKKHKDQTRPVDGPQEIKRDGKNISELQDERISHEPQVSCPSSKFLPHFKMREKLHLGADHSPQNCTRDWRMGFKWTKLFSAALCFTVLMAHGVSGWTGEIHGRVVCDVCGDSSIGPEDHVLQGAEVAVLCITKSGEVLNYQAFTNVNGIYTVAETMPESERWDACLARPISSFHHHCTHLGDGSTGVKFSYTLPSGYSHTVRPFVYRPTAAPAYCN